MPLMDFADSLSPEDMAEWNKAIIAEVETGDNTTGEKKPAGVYVLLGIAVGCIGMSHDDFCKCTVGEFESICNAWHEMREEQYHDSWERTRTVAAICIQPHVRKRITPRQLLPLPWDNKKPVIRNNAPQLTAQERKERFEKLAQKVK